MGHFSYTCHLSGLPITGGTPAVLIPLVLSRYGAHSVDFLKKDGYGVGSIISNEGCNAIFKEACYPIFGEYNEYGSLENIIKDDNTKTLEEFFGMSIEDIVECILDMRKDNFMKGEDEKYKFSSLNGRLKKDNPRHHLLLKYSATWMRKDVYDSLASRVNKDKYRDSIDLGTHGLLTSLGFEELPVHRSKKTKAPRFHRHYVKGKVNVYTDGNWIASSMGEQVNSPAYNLKDFKKWVEDQGEPLDIRPLVKDGMTGQIYEHIILKMDGTHGDLEQRGDHSERRATYALLGEDNMFEDRFFSSMTRKLVEELDKKPNKSKKDQDALDGLKKTLENPRFKGDTIPGFYFKTILEKGSPFLKENMRDWHEVKHYFYVTGRPLFPIGTAPQDGEFEDSLFLAKVTHELMATQFKKWKED